MSSPGGVQPVPVAVLGVAVLLIYQKTGNENVSLSVLFSYGRKSTWLVTLTSGFYCNVSVPCFFLRIIPFLCI